MTRVHVMTNETRSERDRTSIWDRSPAVENFTKSSPFGFQTFYSHFTPRFTFLSATMPCIRCGNENDNVRCEGGGSHGFYRWLCIGTTGCKANYQLSRAPPQQVRPCWIRSHLIAEDDNYFSATVRLTTVLSDEHMVLLLHFGQSYGAGAERSVGGVRI